MTKKITAAILAACMVVTIFASCGKNGNDTSSKTPSATQSEAQKDPVSELTAVASNDNYRNYYEILLYTFCDSNGDGVGDIKGLISKLDYLNDGDPNTGEDLGVDGIWLLPIMPSPSYHKYNTTDYYGVDPEYGTMDDFKALSAECKKRGIKIILDLVLNHTSTEHPWFTKMSSELKQGKTDGFAQMYSLVQADDKPNHFSQVNTTEDWYYECNFMPSMPELNLSSKMCRSEIKKIMEFWMEAGVSGFRLDAVKYFTASNPDGTDKSDGKDFLNWLEDTARSINSDAYLVGEYWESSSKIKDYYESGVDSLFNFDGSGSNGRFANAVRTSDPYTLISSIKRYQDGVLKRTDKYIDGVFLSNHDQVRIGTILNDDALKLKMAAALYMLCPGNSFVYYGEELGTGGSVQTQDASFRTSMTWSEKEPNKLTPPGFETLNVPKGGGVAEQLADKASILNFYRRIIKIKNQNPEIARGTITEITNFDAKNIGGYVTDSDGKKVLVVHNMGKESQTVEISAELLKTPELRAYLNADSSITATATINGAKLTIPSMSTAILAEKAE